MANAEILATTLGTENTYGTVAGRTPAGPFSYARITTDDRNGVVRTYIGDGEFVNDPLDTFGSRAVVKVPRLQAVDEACLQEWLRTPCRDERVAYRGVLHEAFSTYFGWDTYLHGAN